MRYALYFTPPADDPLTITAANWLGRDAFSGVDLALKTPDGMDADMFRSLTEDPRRYGFHATLKAPFPLAANVTEAELVDAFHRYCDSAEPFDIPELILGRLGNFFALVPGGPCEPLTQLANDCVSLFDRFRAPLSEADIARRKPDELSANQRMNLMTWGYPYVLDDFRFHMTLTGQVPQSGHAQFQAAIEDRFSGLINRPRPVTTLALFVEPAKNGPFTVHTIRQFGRNASRKSA